MKLRLPSVGGYICSTYSTLQTVKHDPSRESRGINVLCSEIESGAF